MATWDSKTLSAMSVIYIKTVQPTEDPEERLPKRSSNVIKGDTKLPLQIDDVKVLCEQMGVGNIYILRDARFVMVTVVGNGYGEPSSNPGQGFLHFSKL